MHSRQPQLPVGDLGRENQQLEQSRAVGCLLIVSPHFGEVGTIKMRAVQKLPWACPACPLILGDNGSPSILLPGRQLVPGGVGLLFCWGCWVLNSGCLSPLAS